MNTTINKLALAISALVLTGGAIAADSAGSMGASATIAAECSVNTAGSIAITGPDMKMLTGGATSTENAVSTATFQAICTNGTTLPKLAYSQTVGTSFALVGATTATDTLAYTLHQDATATLAAVTFNTAIAHPGFTANGISQPLALSIKIAPVAKNGKLVQQYNGTITVTSSFGA